MNEATPLSNSVEGMVGKGTSISTATGDNNNNNNTGRFRTTVVTFVSGMVVTMMMMMMAVSNTNTNNYLNGMKNNNNVNYLEDSEGEVIRGRSKGFKYGAYGATRDKSSKSSKSWKSSKKSTSPPGPTPIPPRTASIRIVENIDPTDPNGSGDIILSLGFNPLTQALSLVGSNFVTNGSVFRSQDIQVVDGALVAPIPFEQQLGDSSSTCTITKGTFQPDQGVVFIKSATCHYATCFPTARTVVVEDDEDEEEFCFFGMSGGTLDIDAATLIFGKTINGVLQGGTGPFGGFAGSFTVNKIVQGVFPPPSATEIQYNIFQVDFIFAETMDMEGCPVEICEQQEPRYQPQ
mmetsp:Transcript_41068/g.45775  ORF Transcript_41068/g.45775 Transcript_41068/m.45775 type:complete len:348 (-) Transcript_41068:278-1321(-)